MTFFAERLFCFLGEYKEVKGEEGEEEEEEEEK